MPQNVEQTLRFIEDRATLMRLLTERAAESPASAEPQVFTGLADVFEDIAESAAMVRRSLNAATLDAAVTASPTP